MIRIKKLSQLFGSTVVAEELAVNLDKPLLLICNRGTSVSVQKVLTRYNYYPGHHRRPDAGLFKSRFNKSFHRVSLFLEKNLFHPIKNFPFGVDMPDLRRYKEDQKGLIGVI